MIRIWALSVLGLLCVALPAAGQTSVAVFNFQMTSNTPEWKWAEKGLADQITTDLADNRGISVVARDQMQILARKLGWAPEIATLDDATVAQARKLGRAPKMATLDDAAVAQVRKHLKIQFLVTGVYSVSGQQVEITAQIVNVATRKEAARKVVSGQSKDILELRRRLSAELLGWFVKTPAEEVLPTIVIWTRSVPATRALYEGMHLYDQGRYAEAWVKFRRAGTKDPAYVDTQYWVARMYYYMKRYDHARVAYERFVYMAPGHHRIGDAIMEFVHTHERLADGPEQLLELYQTLGARRWQDVRVHNQVDYTTSSPLAGWLLKRQQQVLRYQRRYRDAFVLVAGGIDAGRFEVQGPVGLSWRTESIRLLRGLAQLSEDTFDQRLVSDHLPFVDIVLDKDNPVAGEDLRGQGLKGRTYKWGRNYRILAPKGFSMKTLTVRIGRTNDPANNACCRLQIRRYRYVDVHNCWTENHWPKGYTHQVDLPPGCTWFYLRPEYLGGLTRGVSGCKASFDSWAIEAELEPLGPVGRIDLRVSNSSKFHARIDGVYARCFNGVITNLSPGRHKLQIVSMYKRKHVPWRTDRPWDFQELETEVEVQAGQTRRVDLALTLKDEVKAAGWDDPVGVANDFPWFKHRPRRSSNWRYGRPSIWLEGATGRKVVVWSNLDDVWMAVSKDGRDWSGPTNLPLPVNSAHVELAPRLIRDERGRFCLLFLSDRGPQRRLASYVCWSRDLKRWSSPVRVSATSQVDHDLIQAQNGQYVYVGTSARSSSLLGRMLSSSVQLRRSRDMIDWSEPVAILNVSGASGLIDWSEPVAVQDASGASGLCLRQDRTGVYHLVYLSSQVWHAWSTDLKTWSKPAPVPHRLNRSIQWIGADTAGDRLVVVIGNYDGGYSGRPVFDLAWRPVGGSAGQWRAMQLPRGVVDGMCGVALAPGGGDLVLAWQVADETLNSVFPSGPVYFMAGGPSVWSAGPATAARQ